MVNVVVVPLLLLCAATAVVHVRLRVPELPDADQGAIDNFMKSPQWRTIELTRDDHSWNYSRRYLLRRMTHSSCARIYIVLGEQPGGDLREIHLAYDPCFPRDRRIQVLLEREIAQPVSAKAVGKPAPDDLL